MHEVPSLNEQAVDVVVPSYAEGKLEEDSGGLGDGVSDGLGDGVSDALLGHSEELGGYGIEPSGPHCARAPCNGVNAKSNPSRIGAIACDMVFARCEDARQLRRHPIAREAPCEERAVLQSRSLPARTRWIPTFSSSRHSQVDGAFVSTQRSG